jgi:serine/threonine-protein kinase HipA
MKLRVFCNDVAVGALEMPADATRAPWTLTFDKTPAVPLSPHLSATAGETISGDVVRQFFVNLLPESPYAERVAARFDPKPQTDAAMLFCIGQELAGAYALNAQALAAPYYAPLTLKKLEQSLADSRHRADAIAFEAQLPRLSLAGAQDKFALWHDPAQTDPNRRFKIPQGRAASTHIFKPASTDTRYGLLPANEFACAKLARALSLRVADTDILTLGGVRVLVVRRFDRERIGSGVGAGIKRLHQVDLCQLLNLPRERKYGSEGGIDTAEMFTACSKLAVPALARRSLLRAWLFNYLIGNHDAHAKNFSFQWSGTAWYAAPMYDLISVTPYLPAQPLSMGLLDEHRPGWFVLPHWTELARLAGVTRPYLAGEMRSMVEGAKRAAPDLAPVLRATLTSDELDFLAERVNPIVAQRAAWLLEGAAALN